MMQNYAISGQEWLGTQGGGDGEEEGMPAEVAANPEVAQALQMRQLLMGVEVEKMDSWEFDVFEHSHDYLIACLCQMFMQQGLCQSRVTPPPSPNSFDPLGPCCTLPVCDVKYCRKAKKLAVLQHVASRN